MGLSIMTFCSRSQRRLVLFRRSCFFKISPMPGLSFGTRLIGLLPSAPGALGSDGLMASGDPPVQALYGKLQVARQNLTFLFCSFLQSFFNSFRSRGWRSQKANRCAGMMLQCHSFN
jgi:hypothetical protein